MGISPEFSYFIRQRGTENVLLVGAGTLLFENERDAENFLITMSENGYPVGEQEVAKAIVFDDNCTRFDPSVSYFN